MKNICFVFRRSKAPFLCPQFLKSSTLCATLATSASSRADMKMPKIVINKYCTEMLLSIWSNTELPWCDSVCASDDESVFVVTCLLSSAGNNSAGKQRPTERAREREDQDSSAPSLSEPFSHWAPSGEPTQSPQIWKQSPGDRLRQHKGSFPLRAGQTGFILVDFQLKIHPISVEHQLKSSPCYFFPSFRPIISFFLA